MTTNVRHSKRHIERQRVINQQRLIRQTFIRHLQDCNFKEVDLDSYVLIALELFKRTNSEPGRFEELPADLVDVATNTIYGLVADKVKSQYVASMMLNIRNGVLSNQCESLPVQCPECGDYCMLQKSHHSGRQAKSVYYCEKCDYSVRAFEGDKWPMGIPASREIRAARGQVKLAIDGVAEKLNVSPRIVRLRMAGLLGLPIGHVASEGYILNQEYVQHYETALSTVHKRMQSA
ncbi:zinc-finger-containing protein [Vibrio tubiashii]|uniref:zinc-finger-containing protein n=1 Tax=Vibrio tubiashii TaxID=29498 RepID=UPI001EFC5598|nr:zinc-finger-containing protein [Vibrio tubiashii]MCG9576673.1 zinc-finger-containing protein [Vibrio tubiashii]